MPRLLASVSRRLLSSASVLVCCTLCFWACAADAKVEQVIIVFKTHFDIGYTDLASNVVQRYRTKMIDDALKVVDQNRDLPKEQQFVWTIPGWPLSKIAEDWPGQTPERQERIREAFKGGRFVVHALPFTTHTGLLEPEDLVRGLGFASRLSRDAGLALPRDAKMTDVPCHSWIMPTLLRHAGVDFLHLGCNAASSSPRVPRLFWWEGPDVSRLLTMYTAESYGTGLVPPKDWPHKTWLALIHTGDNHGPPTPEEVKKLLGEAAQKLPGLKVRIGRLSDFADAILAEKGTAIPLVRGDMPDTWIHGPMCDPQGAKLARNTRPAIGAGESLGTLLRLWGVSLPDTRATVERAYEQSLLYGEHTWGGALYWVTKYGSGTKWGYGDTWKADHAAGRFQRLEASWAEHTSYIETARDLLQPLQSQELTALARSVNVSGTRIVVFNPLPWTRSGLVTVRSPSEVAGVKIAGETKRMAAASQNQQLLFVGDKVPSFGYQTFEPDSSARSSPDIKLDQASGSLENSYFKVVLDPSRGCIRSLLDKHSGRELVDANAPHGFGQYLYERFASNQVAAYVKAYVKIDADWAINELGKPSLPPADQAPYRAASPRDCSIEFQQNAVMSAALMRSEAGTELPHGVETRVILYEDQPFVDVEITIKNKPAEPWPEAGWLCLPFNVATPQFRIGRQGSIIDPAKDIVPGANRNLMALNTGLAVFSSRGSGAGLCPLDSPLVSLGEPGCWKYSLDYVPRRAWVYVNLFNNQWTTNFRLWNEGTWTSRVRIWAFDRYTAEDSLVRPSLEARYPLQAGISEGPAGGLPTSRQGLQLSRKDVLVTAFGPNPDGPGTVLRLWELAGESGPCRIRLPDGLKPKAVQPVNLRGEEEGKAISVRGGGFSAEVKAFAPASFVLQDEIPRR